MNSLLALQTFLNIIFTSYLQTHTMAYFNIHKHLTTSQFEVIVNRRKPKGLIRLNLRNLSDVDPQILAKSILDNQFDVVELKETSLTNIQLETIFTHLALIPEKREMFILDLSQNNLSEVHPKIMSRAVVKVGQVDLNDTFLSMEQAEVLFKEIIENEDLCISTMTIDKHICKGKNNKLSKAVAKKIELIKVDAESEEFKKMYNEQGPSAILAALRGRQFDEHVEGLEADVDSDWDDYVVDSDEDDATVEADFRRSEKDFIRKYAKIMVEENIKRRGKMQ